MRKILLMLMILATTLMAESQKYQIYYNELVNASQQQKEFLFKAYAYGSKRDYGETLAAVSWRESSLGENRVNPHDGHSGSFGPFQCLLKSAQDRHKVYNRNSVKQLAQRLTHDFEFAADEAMTELDGWKSRWKNTGGNTYRKMLAGYNAGSKGYNGSVRGKKYADDVALRVLVIRSYLAKSVQYQYSADGSIIMKDKHNPSATLLTKNDLKIQATPNPIAVASVTPKNKLCKGTLQC